MPGSVLHSEVREMTEQIQNFFHLYFISFDPIRKDDTQRELIIQNRPILGWITQSNFCNDGI